MHLTSLTQGNGVLTTQQSFDPKTGLFQTQQAGMIKGSATANFAYGFDTIGNLTYRTDANMGFTERFCYDNLNRLTNSNIGASCLSGKTVSYDSVGNITTKSDAGTYFYPPPDTAQPHAVSSITGTVDGLTNPNFSYDANGNMTCMSTGPGCTGTAERQLTAITSFNMAATLVETTTTLPTTTTTTNLTYDDQHARITQAVTVSGVPNSTTTTYLNDPASGAVSQNVQVGTAVPTWVDYIQVDGRIVAQRSVVYQVGTTWGSNNWAAFDWSTAGGVWGSFNWGAANWQGPTVAWSFFSLDHLGSIAVITDQWGNVAKRLSYDPWGKQRNSNGTDAACGTITSITTRGFTNQEQMPAECLVNLNARIYDPSIGRFMAADTIVPDPFNGQSFNRFSYVINNPLSFTDPTGHDCPPEAGCKSGELRGIGAFGRPISESYCFGNCSGVSAGSDYTHAGSVARTASLTGTSGGGGGAGPAPEGTGVDSTSGGIVAGNGKGSGGQPPVNGDDFGDLKNTPLNPDYIVGSNDILRRQIPNRPSFCTEGCWFNTLDGAWFWQAGFENQNSGIVGVTAARTGPSGSPLALKDGLGNGGEDIIFGIATLPLGGEGFAAKAAAKNILVIGRLADTAVAKDWAGHAIISVPNSQWSIAVNDALVSNAINARQTIYLATPTTEENLFDAVAGRATVYGRELKQFLEAGYSRVGDYLYPLGKP